MLSFIVCIIGLIVYLLAKPPNDKMKEIGRIMFWVGLLAFLLAFGNWHPAGFVLFGR